MRPAGTRLTRLLQNDSWGGTGQKKPENWGSGQDQKAETAIDFSNWYHKDFKRNTHLCIDDSSGRSTSEIVRNTYLALSRLRFANS